MLASLVVALSLQVSVRVGSEQARTDSVRRVERDSIAAVIRERRRMREERAPRRIPVTPELERSAFRDAAARDLLHMARAARLRQDSSLLSYEATTYQRMSVGLGFRAIGRDRLLFRTENATKVRWSRDGGAWVEVTGRRSVAPTFGQGGDVNGEIDLGDMSPLPYYPGREALWVGSSSRVRAEVDDRELVHPIALGSEAYYVFSTGDSLVFTLPDGAKIRLRELRVEPRRPEWRLSVGSFWFDGASGQLVRAVYRLAVPLNIWQVAEEESRDDRDEDDVPGWVKGMMSPLEANLEAVTIEYGLFGSRFWLPRTQYAEGWARAGFMRIPFKIEESFKYGGVNVAEGFPPIPRTPMALRDSLFPGDSTRWADLPAEERERRNKLIAQAAAERAKARVAARRAECEQTGSYTRLDERYDGAVRMAVRVPCDTAVLARSPDLPASIFDPAEELFGENDRFELLKALDFGLQAAWAPRPITWTYGLALSRYNRVEGFSTAIRGTTELGRGYSVDALARLETGDWEPNAELGITRTNGRTDWRLGGYRRLAVSNDWGAPLGFGAGLGAFVFGRDDGFYYRTAGVELERRSTRGGGFTTRFFAEHQTPAEVSTRFSVARALGSASEFADNFDAVRGNAFGVAIRDVRSFGLDPRGWRAFSDLRLEGAWFVPGDTAKAEAMSRAALDVTVSRGLGERLAAAITVGAGIADQAPVQRHFFLGGSETVRGQRPGTAIGEAYWLGRLEIGGASTGARPVVFGDIGWAGPRDLWSKPGRPLSGAGVGMSFLDGLIRADLARGIYPRKGTRFDLYVEAKF